MSRRYYWLKLKKDFFKDPKIMLIQRKKRGKEILLFYIFLLTESIEGNGRLAYDDQRGYDEKELAQLFGFTEAMVHLSLETLISCGFVHREENGALMMNGLSEMVGSEGDSAVRMRKSRNQVSQCDNNVTESKRKEKDKEVEKEIEVEEEDATGDDPRYRHLSCQKGKQGRGVVFLTEEQDEELLKLMDLEVYDKYIAKLADFIIRNDAKVANHYQTILKWYEEDRKV